MRSALQRFSKWQWCCSRRKQDGDEFELLPNQAQEDSTEKDINYDNLYHTIPKFVIEKKDLEKRSLSSNTLQVLCQEFGVEFNKNKIKCIKDVLKSALKSTPDDVSKIIEISTLDKNLCQFKITPPMLRIFYPSFYDNLGAVHGDTMFKETEAFKQYRLIFIRKLLQQAETRLGSQAPITQAGPSTQPAQNRLLLGESHRDPRTRTFVAELVANSNTVQDRVYLEIFSAETEQSLLDDISARWHSFTQQEWNGLSPQEKMGRLIPTPLITKVTLDYNSSKTQELENSPLINFMIQFTVNNIKLIAIDSELLGRSRIGNSLNLDMKTEEYARLILFNQFAFNIITKDGSENYVAVVGENHANSPYNQVEGLGNMLSLTPKFISGDNQLTEFVPTSTFNQEEALLIIQELKAKVDTILVASVVEKMEQNQLKRIRCCRF